MAEGERDPLEALAEAWRGLEAPGAEAELAELDAETRAAVQRLRAAWGALAAPPGLAPVEVLLRRRAAPAARARSAALRPWLSAAALLLVLGAAAALGRYGGAARRGEGAAVAQLGPAPAAPVSTLPFGAGASVERLTPERIELSAGNVRLVLLTGPAPGARTVSDDADDERMDR